VVDAKETITYSSPIIFFRKTKRKLLLKTLYTHSTQSPLEGPKYIKKDMHKIKAKKTAEHLVNKYNK
jgi:hypothetical protein